MAFHCVSFWQRQSATCFPMYGFISSILFQTVIIDLRKPDMRWVTKDEIKRLVSRMKELVADDHPYHRHEVHQGEAADLFASIGLLDKLKLVETCGEEYAYYYTLTTCPITITPACCHQLDI